MQRFGFVATRENGISKFFTFDSRWREKVGIITKRDGLMRKDKIWCRWLGNM